MADFYKMKGAIGTRARNHPADVAFVQLVVKRNGGLIRPKAESQIIDGRYHDELLISIADRAAGRIRNVRIKSNVGEGGFTLLRTLGNRLNKFLPADLVGYQLFVNAVGGPPVLSLLASPAQQRSGKARYRASDIHLPDDLKHSLLKFLKKMSRRAEAPIRILKVGIISGKFAVSLKLDEGLVIDRSTGRVKNSKAPRTIEWLIKRLKSNVARGWLARHWDFEPRDGLFLTSKKTYSFLELTTYQKGFILSYIPTTLRPLIVGDEMTEKCFTAYQYGRIAGTMTPERERIFHQCFGPKKNAILQHESALRTLCDIRTREFTIIARNQIAWLTGFDRRREALAAAIKDHDEFQENGLYGLLLELSIDVVSLGRGKVAADAAKRVGERPASTREIIVNAGAEGLEFSLLSNRDNIDALISLASVTAFIVFGASMSVPLAAGLALASMAKSVYDYLGKSEAADDQVRIASKEFNEATEKLAENTQVIADFWQAAEAEGCAWLLADVKNDVGISVLKLVEGGRAAIN